LQPEDVTRASDIAGWGPATRVTAERTLTLAAGGTIDFVVGWGNGNYVADSTGLSATIDRLVTLTVGLAGAGAGSVASTPTGVDCGFDCAEDYPYGTTITLTAMAAVGSTFSHWSDACSGTASTCEVTLDAAKSVTATFTRNRHALDVTTGGTGGGAVTSDPAGIDCGSDCAQDYDEGTVVNLTASPAAGSVFDGWGGACVGTSSTCEVTLTAPRAVAATFRRSPATIRSFLAASSTPATRFWAGPTPSTPRPRRRSPWRTTAGSPRPRGPSS
jgi:hypothetical protein